MNTLPDISLADAFAGISSGNIESFNVIFSRYYDRLYTTALQYCKIDVLAEDVVQQVFLKLWEKRNALTTIANPEAWLFTLARNQVLDMLRRQVTNHRYTEYIKEFFLEEDTSPEQLMINRQKRELVKKSLLQLSPRQQEIYRLNREQGLTYEEIARQLGIGKATVKEHIANALHRIKQFLIDHRHELTILLIVSLK